MWGSSYHQDGELFGEATFDLRPGTRIVRFEIVDAAGIKAWSNPFDLSIRGPRH